MQKFGFTGKITELICPADYEGFELGRVVVEHRERYVVQTEAGTYNAEITGNLRYTATSRLDFPAVGDWVKVTMMDLDTAVIMQVFPRTTVLERQAPGRSGEVQQCKFSDCTHTSEVECAVLDAVEAGVISENTYDNYLKMKREQEHFTASSRVKRQKSREQGKMYKEVMKEKRKERKHFKG